MNCGSFTDNPFARRSMLTTTEVVAVKAIHLNVKS